MKYKLIFNPAASHGKAEKIWPRIQECLDQRDMPYELSRTSKRGEALILAKEAVQNGFDKIIAVGGDGLTHEVVNGMVGSDAALGIIPCGSGNDAPRLAGISGKSIGEACDVIREGHTKKIDLGKINDGYFLNNVGLAIDGEIGERKQKMEKYLRGFFAYLGASLPTLFTYKPKRVQIQMDDTFLPQKKVLLISIGNGKFCGGGFQLTPFAAANDGLLDVCVLDYIGTLKALWHLPKTMSGKHVKLPFCKMYKAKKINIKCETLLTAEVDGEISKEKEYRIKVIPQGLELFAKRDF
ncbi:MAG: diacylglycerol kinase family protein [Candidatus Margulisiibacteriota bacterium]|nr:diacylglycerol kinase family protein [Candidatus Margulisiibacteriota bacterium]